MKLNDTARQLIGSNHATLVTANRDGSPQVSVVWVTVQSTADGGDELVTAHLAEHLKIRNIRRDPRVSLCVLSEEWNGAWVQVDGRAEVLDLPEALEPLVDYFRCISGEHPNWDEYRNAMRKERRVIVAITLTRAGPDRSG